MTKFQLHTLVRSLLAASRRQSDMAEPGTEAFDIHMGVAITLGELAHVAHDLYCATHTNEGDTANQKEHTDNETT
jgi:hypothetical protein